MNAAVIKGGYILLARNTINSAIWSKPPLYFKVWSFLLIKAQHDQFNGLQRGQIRTSIPEIIEGCAWYQGYRKVYPTKDQVFQIIEWLRKPCTDEESAYVNPTYPPARATTKATMIATTRATQGMIINIDNYEFYQNPKNYESNDESNDKATTRATREQRQPDNINKNDKNVKNDKKEEEIPYREIIDFLNLKVGTQYKHTTESYKTLIRARWNQGYRLEAFQKVITNKANDWMGTEQAKYLRPETLFGTKFDSYLNQLVTVKIQPSQFDNNEEMRVYRAGTK
jgi:uncharacterized phage protein (TIGR02220 family)